MATAPSSSPSHVPLPISIIETYSLISDGSTNENGSPSSSSPRLSAFVVRLTDASLKALQQAINDSKQKKGKGAVNGFVEISNRGNSTEGTLSFGGTSSVVHRFSLTDAQRDLGPKGQLDVVEQQRISDNGKIRFGKTSSCGKMKSIGPVTQRLQISATTEDTFESTKQKAQQANEEMRKTAAKVALKGPAAAGGATKVWQKINKAQASTSKRPLTPLSHQKSSMQSKSTPGSNSGSNGIGSGGGDITKRPLRQRILYKLLPNAMTAVDLLSKLSSEGLTDQERSMFDRVLNEVAQVSRPADSSSNGNVDALCLYEVKKSCYPEIRIDDWPFYTQWERQHCRKKLVTYKNPAPQQQQQQQQQQQHSSNGSTANGANQSNSDDTTRRVSGKVSYRPPPKKPAANDSPKTLPGNNTVSPPLAASISSASPRPSPSTTSPTPGVAMTNGTSSHNHADDNTTQRVSAKSSYKPPPKKPAASPSIGTTGKSPPAPPILQPSPSRPPSSTTTSPTTIASASSSAYSPPPKKKAHRDNDAIGGSVTSVSSPKERSVAAVNGSNGHDFDDDTDLRRKKRQQHQRPALTTSNNNHVTTNGHSNNHVVSPAPPTNHLDDGCWTNPQSANEYRNEYPAINSADDRRRYKADFDREYPVYLKLYQRLQKTAAEFEKLGDKLRRTTKETPEYKDIEREIISKYRQFQQDTDVNHSRKEHERLRRKLGVIKERVKEYDDRQLVLPVVNGINDW